VPNQLIAVPEQGIFENVEKSQATKIVPNRVTRLGKLGLLNSPIGFTLGSFLKIAEVAKIIGLFSNGLVLIKNGFGYILGNFFTNAPGSM
jgi:hypothetical protein